MAKATQSTTADLEIERVPITLPTVPSEVSDDINDYSFLFYGHDKTFKTTLTTQEEGVLLLTFDPIERGRRLLQRHVPDWNTFMSFLAGLEQFNLKTWPYKRVVIDAMDIGLRRCQKWCENRLAIDYIGELKYAKGWSLMKETFADACSRYMNLPHKSWFISHAKSEEPEDRNGDSKLSRLIPAFKGSSGNVLSDMVDGTFLCEKNGMDRVLVIDPGERAAGGHRLPERFHTPKGRPVRDIHMGESAAQGYANLLKAFNNKQLYTTIDEWRRAREKEREKGAIEPAKK